MDESAKREVARRFEDAYLASTLDDLTLQPPSGPDIGALMDEIRAAAKAFATTICECVPDSQERNSAIDRLRETLFWAVGGIAVHQDEARLRAILRNGAVQLPKEARCMAHIKYVADDLPGPYRCDLEVGHEGDHQHQFGWVGHGRLHKW